MTAKKTTLLLTTALATLGAAVGPGTAAAAPALNLSTSGHIPQPVPAGTYARYTVVVSNTGNEPTSGPVEVDFSVPVGAEIGHAGGKEEGFEGLPIKPWTCTVAPDARSASCTGIEPIEGFGLFPIEAGQEACAEPFFGFIPVDCGLSFTARDSGAGVGTTVTPTITACGGGASVCPAVAATAPPDPFEIGPYEFRIANSEGTQLKVNGDPDTEAGSRPENSEVGFSFSTALNSIGAVKATAKLKDAVVELPPGVIGNPQAVPTCTAVELADNKGKDCPHASQVGYVLVHVGNFFGGVSGDIGLPLFNMEPPPGVPALLGFEFETLPLYISAKVRTGQDYGVTLTARNTPVTLTTVADEIINGATTVIWGVPASPTHDGLRGYTGDEFEFGPCVDPHAKAGEYGECSTPSEAPLKPFVTLPTSCPGTPPQGSVEVTAWGGASDHDTFDFPTVEDCAALDFSPTLQARPTTNIADAPSGLDVDLKIPQHEECTEEPGPVIDCERAEAELRDTTVTLPEGLVVNPSSANGLDGCSEADFGFTNKEGDTIHTTAGPATCPDAAKLGSVEVETPLLDHPLPGAVYLAKPYDNPFGSLLALYISVDDPQSGVVAKLAGEVHADPNTGRLTASVLHNPQIPFEHFKLHFFGGARGSLRTPAACGSYQTTSSMTPWTAPEGETKHPSDTWAIQQGPGGGQCPTSAGTLPNSPDLDAGSISPVAALATPTVVTLRRDDGTQEFSSVRLTLPPGLTGKLAGIEQCPDAALASASSKSGRQEEASPSCPANSRVGRVDVAVGAGPAPYNAGGTAYLTGPYKGAPLGMAIVTPATAGPFDLGTVVVRVALYLDASSGRITAVSDEIPRILQGIPLDVRSARVLLDRDNFTRNGTSCDPFSFNGLLTSALNQVAPLSERFQLGECSSLSFKPKLGIRLFGGTRRGAHPALRGTVSLPAGSANVAKASVALPHSEFLDQGHIGTVCTRVQFSEGDGNGSNCPAASIYGHAVATSSLVDYALEGNAYLRSSSHKLPDLVIALHGPPYQPVAVDVVGRIDSVNGGIRTTFEGVPDLPVSSFVLKMEGGRKGLLQNSTNICKGVHKAAAEFDGQNGKPADLKPVLKNSKCGKRQGRAKRRARSAHRRAAR